MSTMDMSTDPVVKCAVCGKKYGRVPSQPCIKHDLPMTWDEETGKFWCSKECDAGPISIECKSHSEETKS